MDSKVLLGRGYFSSELIPPFNSEGLLLHYDDIKKRCKTYNYKSSAKSINFSIPRIRSSRRKLTIPNPFFQFKLCNVIEDNWQDIESKLDRLNTSLSKPVKVNQKSSRALERRLSYSEIATRKILMSVSAKYMVYADISRFYGTVYTHSIPWAIHSKALAKADHTDNLYGNTLDKFIRNSQEGQTLGIPTGPDSSFLISELITSKVDEFLEQNLSSAIKRFRYIDDFYFFCKTLSDTEIVITQLTKALSEFELELNPDKTRIILLPEEFEPAWVSELRAFKFSNTHKKQKADIINYFSKVFSFAKKYPYDFIIKYAITRIKNKKFENENWKIFESLLLQSIISEPSVIKVVLEIFLKYKNAGYNLGKNEIKSALYTVLDSNIVHHNSFELLWSLWFARSLNITINKEYANQLIKLDDPLLALAIDDMINCGLISKSVNNKIWRTHENYNSLFGEHWIYAYEAYVKGRTTVADRYLDRSTFYKALELNNVRFYDSTRQIDIEDFEPLEDELNTRIITAINELKDRLVNLDEFQDNVDVLEDIVELIEDISIASEAETTLFGY